MNTVRVLAIDTTVALALALSASGHTQDKAATQGMPSQDTLTAVPLGDVAGTAQSTVAAGIANPFEGDAQAVKKGQTFYRAMNCAGCHGYDGKGGMGPDLTDQYWRYGGVPAAVYKSIYEGRPQGMPAWGEALPPQGIWQIVAYLESLGGTFPPEAYHASLQGDRPGEQTAPEAQTQSASKKP